MKILSVPNVHVALPAALQLLDQHGIERESRNGPVKMAPWPVVTVYERPCERVIFWPERDANPFLHLYESLWMLAGRNDVATLARYAKNMLNYSDDGVTLHGAYGYRWRRWFRSMDQLRTIAEQLKANPDDRRNVLQMWDTIYDLGRTGKDVPCNLMATFQRDHQGRLDLTVFCRSNDIIWGAYGANAVHFSFLLEYMAYWIGCPIGVYRQISVNWHAYVNTLEPVVGLRPDKFGYIEDPYSTRRVEATTFESTSFDQIDAWIRWLVLRADAGDLHMVSAPPFRWAKIYFYVLRAHELYRMHKGTPERFTIAASSLMDLDEAGSDWMVAAMEWIARRSQMAVDKSRMLSGGLSHP